MTKEQIEEIIHQYIKDNLSVMVTLGQANVSEDNVKVIVSIYLGNEEISKHDDYCIIN